MRITNFRLPQVEHNSAAEYNLAVAGVLGGLLVAVGVAICYILPAWR